MSFNYTIVYLGLLFSFACKQTAPQFEKQLDSPTPTPKKLIQPVDRYNLLKSADFGRTWTNAGQGLPMETQVSFLEPYKQEILLASDNMGLFLSQSNEEKWIQIGAKLPGKKINALHVQGQDIYVGVFRMGIFKTSDLGANWQSIQYDLPDKNVQSILVYQDRVYAGTDSGIFILEKESQSWKSTNIKAQTLSIYAQSNKLVAGTVLGTALSEDEGKNWKWIRQKGAVHYTHPIGDRIVELVLNGDLVYSDDWGQTWQETFYQPRLGSYIYEIIQTGDYLLLSNNYGIHRSSDHGKTWTLIHPNERMGFFDLMAVNNVIYGGIRVWDEFRGRK